MHKLKKIKMFTFTPYYACESNKVEAMNKIINGLVKKLIDQN
jgi:hypothetical protein